MTSFTAFRTPTRYEDQDGSPYSWKDSLYVETGHRVYCCKILLKWQPIYSPVTLTDIGDNRWQTHGLMFRYLFVFNWAILAHLFTRDHPPRAIINIIFYIWLCKYHISLRSISLSEKVHHNRDHQDRSLVASKVIQFYQRYGSMMGDKIVVWATFSYPSIILCDFLEHVFFNDIVFNSAYTRNMRPWCILHYLLPWCEFVWIRSY